jgi:hypothetical protein
VHDITELERRGVPGVFVASDPFGEAADSQGAALGYHPDRVLVRHPIQDRTDDEMRALAEGAIDALVGALCRAPTG